MIDEYIGWSSYVNRVILSESKITSGTEAKIEDSLKSGGKRSELQGAYCPDVYAITMDFEAESPVVLYDTDGHNVATLPKTEYQYFMDWYKYKHKYGTVPFQFPKILYSPQTGIKVVDEHISNIVGRNPYENRMEYYKITSTTEGTKSGSCIRVTMTWQTVYSGSITIEEDSASVNGISEATSNHIDILFDTVADTAPIQNLFTLYIDNVETAISNFYYDGAYTVRLWFNELDTSVSHTITYAMSTYGGTSVAKDTHTVIISAI